MFFLIYLILCLIVGLLGINRKFGFWGYFFGSLLLTPIVGLFFVLASVPKASFSENSPDRADRILEEYDELSPSEKARVRDALKDYRVDRLIHDYEKLSPLEKDQVRDAIKD